MTEVDKIVPAPQSAKSRSPRRPRHQQRHHQTKEPITSFENDLNYLLQPTSESSTMVDSVKLPTPMKSHNESRQVKSLKFSASEITQDIDDIHFSEDESFSTSPPRTKVMKKRQSRRNLNHKQSEADILAQFMNDDDHSSQLPPPPNQAKSISQQNSRSVSSSSRNVSRCGTPANASVDDLANMSFISDEDGNTSIDDASRIEPVKNGNITPEENRKQRSLSKKKSRSQLRKKKSRAKLREAKEAASAAVSSNGFTGGDNASTNGSLDEDNSSVGAHNLPPTPSMSELTRKPSVAALIAGIEGNSKGASTSEVPFEVRLRPLNINNTKKSEKLPEIQPVKSIIGLSVVQILKLNANDVKMKTLMQSSTLSKYAQTGINFTSRHTDELFSDPQKQRIFFLLCINVALFEAVGFKRTLQQHSNLLDLFGGYSEINLETTRTRLTPSNKQVHQNNLDYSVLSYLGNILIWAANLQREAGKDLLYGTYGINVDTQTVRDNVGGWHLWDRLHRERKHMSSKRWKHVIKFRTAFPFEVDQFMLILRFMKVDISNLL
ncbi:hypothetical protein DIRU0_E04632 [Diutina rugosa]